jgi:hypothetical protein
VAHAPAGAGNGNAVGVRVGGRHGEKGKGREFEMIEVSVDCRLKSGASGLILLINRVHAT